MLAGVVLAIAALAAVPAGASQEPTARTATRAREAVSLPYQALPVEPALPMGVVDAGRAGRSCPDGATCTASTVSCPGVPTATATLGVSKARGTPRGVIVMFSGGSGGQWWSKYNEDVTAMVPLIRDMGLTLVEVKWTGGIWTNAGVLADYGVPAFMCRTATIVRYVYDAHFLPMGVPDGPLGRCGFCVGGNSGGSDQVGYLLSHFGLGDIIDRAIPSGGPPHSALTKACLTDPLQSKYWLSDGKRKQLDLRYGFASGTGPCYLHDASFSARWDADAVATGGSDYAHPTTWVHFLIGANDGKMKVTASDYRVRLESGGTGVTWELIPKTSHTIWTTPAGRDAFLAALQASTG